MATSSNSDRIPSLADWGPELLQARHESVAQAIGVFAPDGAPVYLNRGMIAILGGPTPEGSRRDYLVNPSFEELVALPGEGLIFAGWLTMGDRYRVSRTLQGQVYRRGDRLLITGEYDVVELDRLERELSRTNQEINNLQRELVRKNVRLAQTLEEAQGQLKSLRDSEARLRRIVENIADPVMVTDLDACIRSVNPAFTKTTGYASAEVLGCTPKVLSSAHHPRSFYEEMHRRLHVDGRWLGNIWNRRKNGEIYVQRLSISRLRDSNDEGLYVAVYNDINQEVRALERAQFQVEHDALTGLPNRVLLFDRLGEALRYARHRRGAGVAVLFIDLDRFKPINDRLGHAVGDRVLQLVAERLVRSVRATDTVARLGGDEFVIVLREVRNPEQAAQIAAKCLENLGAPLGLGEEDLSVGASIGIACGPVEGEDVTALLHRADSAMYAVKRERTASRHIAIAPP